MSLDDDVARLTDDGWGIDQIAAVLKVHSRTVQRSRARQGLARRPREVVDVDPVVRLTAQGLSASAIAAVLGCSLRTVTRIRKRTGCARPGPLHLTAEDADRAEAMLADGCSVREIERTLGRSPGSLKHRFEGRHWTPRQAGQYAALQRRVARKVLG